MVTLVRTTAAHGHLDAMLLAVLEAVPGHGYDLARRIEERSGGVLDVPEGSLYPALQRLERTGLVDSSWRAEGGRRRRVYRLTRSGRRAVAHERNEWRDYLAAVSAVLRTAGA
jgi:transcriptional regulator